MRPRAARWILPGQVRAGRPLAKSSAAWRFRAIARAALQFPERALRRVLPALAQDSTGVATGPHQRLSNSKDNIEHEFPRATIRGGTK